MRKIFRSIGIHILPAAGWLLMKLYWISSKKRYCIDANLDLKQYVVVCWHEELLISPQAYRHFRPNKRASGIISRHFDGEIIARILSLFGITPLRGSSSKGASRVLAEALRSLKNGEDLLITPDGPRGPRHKVSDGAIILAQKHNIPILIVNYKASSYKRASSWDRFVIPMPFCSFDIYIKSISVNTLSRQEGVELLQSEMLKQDPKSSSADL